TGGVTVPRAATTTVGSVACVTSSCRSCRGRAVEVRQRAAARAVLRCPPVRRAPLFVTHPGQEQTWLSPRLPRPRPTPGRAVPRQRPRTRLVGRAAHVPPLLPTP